MEKKSIVSDLLLKQEQKEEEKKKKEENKLNSDDIDFAFAIFMTKNGQVSFLDKINVEGKVFNMADETALKIYHILNEATYVATLERFMSDMTQFGGRMQQKAGKKNE